MIPWIILDMSRTTFRVWTRCTHRTSGKEAPHGTGSKLHKECVSQTTLLGTGSLQITTTTEDAACHANRSHTRENRTCRNGSKSIILHPNLGRQTK